MKVLMYGWELPPHISGGLGVACQGIIQGLLDNNCEVSLVLPGNMPVDTSVFQKAENLTIIQTNFFKEKLNSYFHEYKDKLMQNIQEYAKFAGELAKDIPHDVIHAHDWLTIQAGLEAKKASHKPLFFHIHSLEFERSKQGPGNEIYEIEKTGLEKADRVITVSEFTKNNVINKYEISSTKISVVHNGLFKEQIKEFYPEKMKQPKKKTALFLGRITAQKSPFQFIDAAAKILQKRKDIEFVIAGDGDLFKKAVAKVTELKLGSYIHFTRFLNRDQVNAAYDHSQVYVMPSAAEPFGLTCLEALCHHVPVICSNQTGVSEVIKNIVKVDFWDTDAIAEKISELIDSPQLRTQLISNAIPELYKLVWDEAGKKLVALYTQFTG